MAEFHDKLIGLGYLLDEVYPVLEKVLGKTKKYRLFFANSEDVMALPQPGEWLMELHGTFGKINFWKHNAFECVEDAIEYVEGMVAALESYDENWKELHSGASSLDLVDSMVIVRKMPDLLGEILEPVSVVADHLDTMSERVDGSGTFSRVFREDEAVAIMKQCFKAGKAAGATYTRAALLAELPKIITLVGDLSVSALGHSNASRMIAEDKSLRQPENTEGRKDLYEYLKPSQTPDGRAVIVLTRILAIAMDLPEEEVARHLDAARTTKG